MKLKKNYVVILAMCLLLALACKKGETAAVYQPFNGFKIDMTRNFSGGLTYNVPAGGNIQDAIDAAAAAGGGTVQLANANFTVTTPIRLKSNVTVSGAGSPATTVSSSAAISIFTNDTEGLSNVTVQNMKIAGILTSTNSNGIIISSLNLYHTNIAVANVQILNCGGMGLLIKRANGASVTNCNIHNNGNFTLMHNLYIRECTHATVSGNTLSYSPLGTGLHVAGVCSNITITGNTMNYNGSQGLNVQDTPDTVLVNNNITNSNGVTGGSGRSDGISFTGTNSMIDGNTANNNFEVGVHTWGGSGTVKNSHASGNGTNYSVHGTFTQSNNL